MEGAAPKGLFAGDPPAEVSVAPPGGGVNFCASISSAPAQRGALAGTSAGGGEGGEREGAGVWGKMVGVSGILKSQCPSVFTTQSHLE